MRRLLRIGCGIVGIVVVLAVIAFIAGGRNQSADNVSADYLQPGERSGDSAGFVVRLTNSGDAEIQNPQIRMVVELGGETWSCQGYVDPASGEAVAGTDPVVRPLILPAKTTGDVTILCRMPAAPLEGANVQLR